MIGLWSIQTIATGAGGLQPRELWSRTVPQVFEAAERLEIHRLFDADGEERIINTQCQAPRPS